jgi:hypothetical protein
MNPAGNDSVMPDVFVNLRNLRNLRIDFRFQI